MSQLDDRDQNFFGSAIKNLRVKAQLSHSQLADKVRCHKRELENLEEGKQLPSLLLLSQLCKAMDAEMKDLFNSDY